LFLIALPGQFLFGVTTMTMSAVLTTFLFGVIYYALTGTYFFFDSYIPIAVFLGMHLLFTDPSTSPRSESGRIVFGMVYGLANVVLYALLGGLGIPRFYDKLLPVPLMNLSVRFIDRVVPRAVARFDPARLGTGLAPRQRNLAYIGIWGAAFTMLYAVDGVGDNHPGHRVPFWQTACAEDRLNGCKNLGVMVDLYCRDGSGWACNELGVLEHAGKIDSRGGAAKHFQRGCALRFPAACDNARRLELGTESPQGAEPRLADYPVVLRTGKGPLPDTTEFQLFRRACDQGWAQGCVDLGGAFLMGNGTERDPAKALALFEGACTGGSATACSNLGLMHYTGDGVTTDKEKGLTLLERACSLGFSSACRWYEENRASPDGSREGSGL
jgi:hypothetical protein